ncbi:MAG: hypothetical protein R3D69_18460 [Xanthobacteraceae bacterium]
MQGVELLTTFAETRRPRDETLHPVQRRQDAGLPVILAELRQRQRAWISTTIRMRVMSRRSLADRRHAKTALPERDDELARNEARQPSRTGVAPRP